MLPHGAVVKWSVTGSYIVLLAGCIPPKGACLECCLGPLRLFVCLFPIRMQVAKSTE